MPKSIDLFDDSTMSFGDHLEALRVHLFKSLIGLIIAVLGMLFFADHIITVIRRPIDKALREHHTALAQQLDDDVDTLQSKSAWDWWEEIRSGEFFSAESEDTENQSDLKRNEIEVTISYDELERVVKEIKPDAKLDLDGTDSEKEVGSREIRLRMKSPAFLDLQQAIETVSRPITLNVQEAFMIYLKVAIVSGLVISFPWIAYQMWLFVAAGLYEHEKRYVYIFLPTSMFLFMAGAVFCYFGVFPFVLDFLLGFNKDIGVTPQIRLSEWISFALVLPVMFGISFQLPLVMYFIERMGFVSHETYREKRRLAILIIATLSMFLTPADPMSMIMMMIPLMILYELGIYFCRLNPAKNPYATIEEK